MLPPAGPRRPGSARDLRPALPPRSSIAAGAAIAPLRETRPPWGFWFCEKAAQPKFTAFKGARTSPDGCSAARAAARPLLPVVRLSVPGMKRSHCRQGLFSPKGICGWNEDVCDRGEVSCPEKARHHPVGDRSTLGHIHMDLQIQGPGLNSTLTPSWDPRGPLPAQLGPSLLACGPPAFSGCLHAAVSTQRPTASAWSPPHPACAHPPLKSQRNPYQIILTYGAWRGAWNRGKRSRSFS